MTATAERYHVRADPLDGRLLEDLRALGRPETELEDIARRSATEGRAEWSRALYATGLTERAGRVSRCASLCSAVSVSATSGEVMRTGYASTRCRDRVCSRCASLRGLEIGHDVRELVEAEAGERHTLGASMYFVTLTQPKHCGESARGALRRLMATWAEVMHSKYMSAAKLRVHVLGGLRAVELTFADGQTPLPNGYVPRQGWHAHLHLVLEVKGPARAWWPLLWRSWCVESGADGAAQRCQPATSHRIGQIAKYPVKPLAVEARQAKREVALALVGARMFEGFGSWRSWRRRARALRKPAVEKLHCIGTSLRTVVLMARGESALESPPIVSWSRRVAGEPELVHVVHRLEPMNIIAGGYLVAAHVDEIEATRGRHELERGLEQRWQAREREAWRAISPPLDTPDELDELDMWV